MYALEVALSPIIWLMELVLHFYEEIFFSTGISILLLSFTFALFLLPIQKKSRTFEQRISEKMDAANAEIKKLQGEMKGEKLFLLTEDIYKQHGYHPIQSIGLGTSFFVILPVLISAIFLFTNDAVLMGKSFLFIDDLSQPDRLVGTVNLLPLLMSAITLVDAKLRFKDDKKSQYRFFFIAFVLLLLVYNLPAGLVLYWIGNNVISLVLSMRN